MNRDTQKTRMLVAMAAMAATLGLSATAQAGDTVDTAGYSVVVVDYSDLNLQSAAGNKTLYSRLSSAAERACGSSPKVLGLQRHLQYRACYDSALDRAVDEVGSRQLQALHATDASHNVG